MLTIDAQREVGLTVASRAAGADAYTHQRLSYRWRWEARSSREADMCSVPTRWPKLRAGLDVGKETVISGRVIDDSGQLVGGAFVRLLDSSDEFTAEVVASRGYFRILAAPGSWTVRAGSTIIGSGDAAITIESPGIHEVDIKIATWTAGC